MAECLGFIRYLYLKALVAISRFLLKLLAPTPSSKPDFALRIPSRDKSRVIKVHVYKPRAEENAQSKPAPVLINLYGSGLAIPLHGADDDFCRLIAATTGHVVLDVNYCLAPEYPFPNALNDIEDALKYVLDRPTEYDPSQISISGFSSGGTLALAASTILPLGTFQSLIAFYPATNLYQDPSLRKAPVWGGKDRSPFWTKIFRESYIRGMDARDPRISPAFADTTKFPSRILIVTGELDASAVEAEELAEKARDEGRSVGREVVVRRMKGCGHAFDKKLTGETVVSARKETYELAAEVLRKSQENHKARTMHPILAWDPNDYTIEWIKRMKVFRKIKQMKERTEIAIMEWEKEIESMTKMEGKGEVKRVEVIDRIKEIIREMEKLDIEWEEKIKGMKEMENKEEIQDMRGMKSRKTIEWEAEIKKLIDMDG